MESLKDKIVLITGASAGIGEACAKAFAKEGCKLILTARRINILNELADEIKREFDVDIYTAQLDVKNNDEVKRVIGTLPEKWQEIDILINNAGLAKGFGKIHEDDTLNWETMIDTNIKGLLYVSREVIPLMVKNKKGHVINLGSTAGHMSYPNGGVYCSTKFAVRGITDALRIELLDKNVRVSTVDPGAVETDFSNVRFDGDKDKAKNIYRGMTPLTAVDVAEAVIFCATRPPHANINEIIITPSIQANSFFIQRNE